MLRLRETHTFVAVENNVTAVNLFDFVWPPNPILILGSEGIGITPETLAMCQSTVEIVARGSVRSLNAGVASGLAMADFVRKYAG